MPIEDADEADGHPFLAVAFIRGQTLEARLAREGALPIDDLVRVVAHVAAGLDALHAVGVVHRDVKPANVMVDEAGEAKLRTSAWRRGARTRSSPSPGW